MDDSILIHELNRGSTRAFKEIYDRYHRQLFYMSLSYLKDQKLAEDAVQDIFLKLWEKRGAIDPDRSFKGFIFTILKNHLLDSLKKNDKKIVSFFEVEEHLLPHRRTTDEEIVINEYNVILGQGLNLLPARRKKIFELKKSGYTNDQIAKMLFISVNTVKVQYYHASKFIKSYLKDHADI